MLPPLEALRVALAGGAKEGSSLAILSHSGYAFSGIDAQVVGWINTHLLAPLGLGLQPGSFDVLVGHVAGGIGTVSVPLLLLGAWYLLSRGVIRWHLPVVYLGTFFVLSAVLGGLARAGAGLPVGRYSSFFSGSLVLGAFYVAPDPVTSPLTNRGKYLFGVGLGVLTFLLRYYGTTGDGVAASIVLGNCAAPLLDRWASRRKTRTGRRDGGMTRGRYGVFSSSLAEGPRAGQSRGGGSVASLPGPLPGHRRVGARHRCPLDFGGSDSRPGAVEPRHVTPRARRRGSGTGRTGQPRVCCAALLITSFLTAFFEAVLLVRAPSASASLGIYAPLVAVNCLVLGRRRRSRHLPPWGHRSSARWAGASGLPLALVLIALVRELLGAGTITLFPLAAFRGTVAVGGLVDEPVRALGLAGGALLCLGYLAGAARAITARAAGKGAGEAPWKGATPKSAGGESSR